MLLACLSRSFFRKQSKTKNMELKETIKKIKENIKTGDIIRICQKAGFSRQVYYTACRKKDWNELTDSEMKLITTALTHIKESEDIHEKKVFEIKRLSTTI